MKAFVWKVIEQGQRVEVLYGSWAGEQGYVVDGPNRTSYREVRLDGRTASYHFPERDLRAQPAERERG